MRLLSPASEMYKVPSLPITTPKGSEKPACMGCGASLKSGEPLPAIDDTCAFQLNLVGRGLRSFKNRTTPADVTRIKERMGTTIRDLRIGKRVSQNQRARPISLILDCGGLPPHGYGRDSVSCYRSQASVSP